MTSPFRAGILPPATGLLIVGHGSRRAEANEVVARVADLLRGRAPDLLAVRHAYLEIAAPTIAEGYAGLVADGCAHVVVHPYFLFPGNHSTVDIPAQLAAARDSTGGGAGWTITGPLDVDGRIVDVVLDRVAEALEVS